MSENHVVYDLGEVGFDSELPLGKKPPKLPKLPRVAHPAAVASRAVTAPRVPPPRDLYREPDPLPAPAFTGALSVIVPGSGQIMAGEAAAGLFVMSALALAGALGWAALATFDRIGTTLEIFGVSPQVTVWAFVALYAGTAVLHVGSVVHALRLVRRASPEHTHHPILAALASSVIPGWGQALNGHRIKAAIFLTGSWALAAAWLARTGPVSGVLEGLGLSWTASPFTVGWSQILLVSSAVLWCLAVYDAAATGIYSRGE